MLKRINACFTHWVGGNRKRSLQSMNADQKSLETVFSIDICRQSGDNWQSKTLFLTSFDLRSSMIFKTFSIAAYPVCFLCRLLLLFKFKDWSKYSNKKVLLRTFEPRHDISNNVVYATSKASDQPAHMRSLIRAFTSL